MARTNLSIDREVFEDFAAQAARKNMTMFAFANESLSIVSKIASEGGDPSSLYSMWKVNSILKQADAITLPSDFAEVLIEELYAEDRQRLLKHFRDLGDSMVGLLRMFADDVRSLSMLAKEFGFVVPIKRFSLSDGASGNIQVDVVGAGRSMAVVECSCEFLKAVLNGYGYSVTREDLHPGTMRLWGQKKSSIRSEAFAGAAVSPRLLDGQ
jgi:hypothetical protein